MMGETEERSSIPDELRGRFVKASRLAKVLDKPCAEHKQSKPAETRGWCKKCDRWDAERTHRWMRSVGIALEQGPRVQGKPVVTTLGKLLDLDGVGDMLVRRMTPSQVRSLLD
jgi:hypothetical protein